MRQRYSKHHSSLYLVSVDPTARPDGITHVDHDAEPIRMLMDTHTSSTHPRAMDKPKQGSTGSIPSLTTDTTAMRERSPITVSVIQVRPSPDQDDVSLITGSQPVHKPQAHTQRTPWRRHSVLLTLLLFSVALCVRRLASSERLLRHDQVPATFNVVVEASLKEAEGIMSENLSLQAVERNTPRYTDPYNIELPAYDRDRDGDIGDIGDFECMAWRQTGQCSPEGPREPQRDQSCEYQVEAGDSGYCEIKHKHTGERRRVLPTHCDSLYYDYTFSCTSFIDFIDYGANSIAYTHDTNFSFEANQHEWLAGTSSAVAQEQFFFSRGIVMVIYDSLLLSTYASVKTLRSMGCTLPIELFYRADETKADHPILATLVAEEGVHVREIKDPRATRFYTKLYAMLYSAFDHVLLLDADNFAVRDPTYLFDTLAYNQTGAVFWPDYWHPGYTLFNVHRESLLWQVFDLPFVDMFEQESGQILVDRRRHLKALNVLMYYGFTLPRIHEELRLVWGDKDLFRFAWLKTNSPFYMIKRPPGSAGMLNTATNQFCGVTMVQHDPENRIVFMHRNLQKLTSFNLRTVWSHIQQYKLGSPTSTYYIDAAWIFSSVQSCWAHYENWDSLYTLTPMREFPFGVIEEQLLSFASEGLALMGVKATPAEPIDITETPAPSQR